MTFAVNPNGIPAFSPGLVRAGLARSYPGFTSQMFSTLNGLHRIALAGDTTLSGLMSF